jgi:hypothetical protein
VHGLELRLQDLAPRVDLAYWVKKRIRLICGLKRWDARSVGPIEPNGHPRGPARSRSQDGIDLRVSIRAMRAENLSQLAMCQRLDANHQRGPEGARWDGLTWVRAFHCPKHKRKVKVWLSKAARVTA